MKKPKKHSFAHKDPEKEAVKSPQAKTEKATYSYKEEPYVDRDLKRGIIVILVLGILLAGLYYSELKAEILETVFKYFRF